MAEETEWEEFFRLLEEIDKYFDELATYSIKQIGLALDKKIMGDLPINCRCSLVPEIEQLQQPIAKEEDALIIAAARKYIRTIDGLSKNSG